jgi:type I restriction enzyme, R subunit
VLALFTQQMGYRYLGDWADRAGNHCVEEGLLTAHLALRGYRPAHISAALHKLRAEALLHERTLYAANEAVYQLLRYGVSVKVAAGKVNETVHLMNWAQPADNDFAIAEEVTLKGGGMSGHERRPDIVLYLNVIAVGVPELKNSRVGLGEGIRQCLSNQQPAFNDWFFSTVQLVLAGNDQRRGREVAHPGDWA